METPKKVSKKDLKRQTPAKTSFNSPFNLQWSPLAQEDMHFILKTLTEKVTSMGLEKKEIKALRSWRKKKAQPASAKPEPPSEPPQHSGWTNAAARKQLSIGINEVTKALERNQLQLVLVCKSVKPKHMTDHLITLSASRGVPACQVPRLSQTMSEPLGLKSVLALGFRQGAGEDGRAFADTVHAIIAKVPPLDVAWLKGGAVAVKDPTEGDVEKKGQKRKVESEGEGEGDAPESDAAATTAALQPLKVKRIVANPARKKKLKVK